MSVENLITEHLDIWTSAIKTKSAAGRGSSKKLELVGVKKLRELILELAVRGKLVPQDPNDEPASELLKRIEAEKAQLIKAGKIKKQKSLPQITEEEIRFELPKNWACERLTNLYDVRDGTHDTPKYHETGYPLVTSKNISSGTLDLSNVKLISEEDYIKINERSKVERNDILFAMIGSIGNPVLVDIEPEFSIKNVALFKCYSKKLSSPSYLLRFLLFAETIMKAEASGAVQSFVSLGAVRKFVMAVPPLPEQHRIVAKVDELMALCDQLEVQTESSIDAHKTLVEVLLATLTNVKDADELNENWQTISQHFDVLFTTQASIDQLKQTILQLAVMGKLVKQDPKDEPASKLLERIATEKQQLIKDGKIKKQKPLPPISDEEKPFALPSGWEWAYLNSLLPQFQNGASSRGDKGGKDVIVLRLADIKNWKISLNDTRTLEIAAETIKRYSLKKGDVLIIRVNGSADIVGRFITCESDLDTIYCDHFIRMNFPIECLFTPYLFLLGSSDLIRSKIANLFVSTAGQKTVNQTHIGTLPISLPPFAEQERIVEKVDELMALCDSLKERLNQAQTTQLHLTDAIVEQAL
ncbi:MAG: type I restriction enzyme S subunit [Oleiphilaceae bacterium]|jgi:type I restriction enzyme S subunit